MRFPRNPIRKDRERILPLTNIVFLLLIFFMLVGRLSALDPFQVQPPQSSNRRPAQASGTVVEITAGGRTVLNGKPIDAAALQAAIARRVQSRTGTDIRLKADGNVEATRVVAVMTLLHAAGVEHLRLLTVAPPS